MADHTMTLTEAQEEALLVVTELQRLALPDPELTTDAMLYRLVMERLAIVERDNEIAKTAMREAAMKLPPSMLARLTEGLTADQLRKFDFLLPNPRAEERG